MYYFDLLIVLCFFIFFYRVGIYEYRSWIIATIMGVFSVVLYIKTDFGGRSSLLIQILFQAVYFFSLGFLKEIKQWMKKGK